MRAHKFLRLGMGLCLAGALSALAGCSHFKGVYFGGSGTNYWQHRLDDLLDMGDFGVTLTIKPGFVVYKGLPPILTIGYGTPIDGIFIGVGGGKVGLMRYHQRSYGFFAKGAEEVGYGDFDLSDPRTVDYARTGPLGCAEGPPPGPDRILSCVHYVHLGFVGIVACARWYQIADFVLGFFGADIGFDDGKTIGVWPDMEDWKPEDGNPATSAVSETSIYRPPKYDWDF